MAELDADIERIRPAPATATERIVSLDALRGVAVLGILVMNIYAFAMPFAAYANPLLAGGDDPYNLAVWFVTHIVFDQKFMTIFSMLFGAGIVLMTSRAEARGSAPAPLFFRRQFWLLVIGLAHAYLLWFGDILFFYAVVGMLVYVFRRQRPVTLIVTGCLLMAVAPLLSYAGGTYFENLKREVGRYEASLDAGETVSDAEQEAIAEWREIRRTILPGPAEVSEDIEAYRGGYFDIVRHRAGVVASFQAEALPFFVAWRVGGLMLIGMALLKLGILSGTAPPGFYRRIAIAGYAAGLPLTLVSAANAWAHDFDPLYMFRLGMLPNYLGSVLVALGHTGLVMYLLGVGRLERLISRFAAVGRTALSNYLLQSLVMTSVFYGYGLGLYGKVPRLGQMGFVVAFAILQLILSGWWLTRYRFGPVEWLWRTLTYWRPQALRR